MEKNVYTVTLLQYNLCLTPPQSVIRKVQSFPEETQAVLGTR